MQIIDVGGTFFVVEQIAYMSKAVEEEKNLPIVKIFLVGSSTSFGVGFTSEEGRDKAYNEWKQAIIDYKKK